MTHNEPPGKTADGKQIVSCVAFLAALYQGVDPALWLELRCIDPTGAHKPTTRWSTIDKPHSILKQVQALNVSGYGVYFAPCPRRTKKGSAASAALLTVLWADIDCNGDPVRRAAALARLRRFLPAPSIIIDSGGGWHCYWLLDIPYLLTGEAERKYAAALLHGLFKALDGDPGYVKSVASVMRLPGLVNTKPERGGACVSIIDFEPERRYPLSAFEWLVVTPEPAKIGTGFSPTNAEAHAPLPQVTLDYLNQGATQGTRNKALFDAGFSQSDAQAQLVARYVADGSGETGREREATATIASAYKQSPREPLKQSSPQQNETVSRLSVDTLLEQYTPAAQTTPPTAAQVAELVRACADLDPIAWAAERKRIKAVCKDEFRLTDLDRMYKQAQREQTNLRRVPSAPPAEHYSEVDGNIIYERQSDKGAFRQTVAGWTARVLEWITQVNDDGQSEHVMRLQVSHQGHSTLLDAPSELFGDMNALGRFIAGRAGGLYAVNAGMNKHLIPAILSLSGTPAQRTTYRFFGWTQIDGQSVYVSPQVSVSAQGQLAQPPEVELESRFRDYGLAQDDWASSLRAFEALVPALPNQLAPALVAFALLPIVQKFFPVAAPRPALHLVGTAGSGKSETASLLASFYGHFTRDTPPAQWGDTVGMVESLGYALADALYWVDDYKLCYADEKAFTRFLQSYSRGMGRGRLTRDAKLRQERPCRGLLLSTGENMLEGESSVLSRMLVFDIPPWEKRDPGGKQYARIDQLRTALPGFATHFAQWVAARADDGGLAKAIAAKFESSVKGYRDKLNASLERQVSTGRMIQNWAVLLTVYRLIDEFLTEKDADDMLPAWQDVMVESVRAVQHERAGQLFLDSLGQLLASGQVMFGVDMHAPDEPHPGATLVGYVDGEHVFLLPEIAYREVTRGQTLKFSAAAIGAQLKEDGWLIPGATSLTVQRRVRGISTRFWQLKADALGIAALTND